MPNRLQIDLGSMSLKELRELLQRVDAAMATRSALDLAELKNEAAALARQAGYSLEELFGEPDKKSKNT
jgi:hypothetical protein